MRVKVSTIAEFIICIVFFASTGILNNMPFPLINDLGNWRILTLVLCLLAFLYFGFIKSGIYRKIVNLQFVYGYLLVFLIAMVIEFVFSMENYGESFFDVLVASQGQFYVFGIFAFLYVFVKQNRINHLLDALTKVTLLILIIYFMVAGVYEITGTKLISASVRFGHLRLDPPFFAGIIFIYNFYKFLEEKRSKFLIFILFYLIYLFMLTGTRMEMIATVVVALIMFVFKKRGFSKQLIVIAVVGIAIAIANSMGLFENILETFSENSTLGLSTTVRMGALEYFKEIQEAHPFVGMGYVRGGVNIAWDYILYGAEGKYIISDVGITGFFYKIGYLSLVVIGIPFARIIYIFAKVIRANSTSANSFKTMILGCTAYFAICQVSLAVTDVQRCLLLPFVWALIEYTWGIVKKNPNGWEYTE